MNMVSYDALLKLSIWSRDPDNDNFFLSIFFAGKNNAC